MTRAELLAFLRSHRYAVQASVTTAGAPQAGIVAIAVSDALEVIFDTLRETRKARNLSSDRRIALVIGGLVAGDERTVQLEGLAHIPTGPALAAARTTYFARFPEGQERLSWPGLVHFCVTPTWIRYSDHNQNPPEIIEFDAQQLRDLE